MSDVFNDVWDNFAGFDPYAGFHDESSASNPSTNPDSQVAEPVSATVIEPAPVAVAEPVSATVADPVPVPVAESVPLTADDDKWILSQLGQQDPEVAAVLHSLLDSLQAPEPAVPQLEAVTQDTQVPAIQDAQLPQPLAVSSPPIVSQLSIPQPIAPTQAVVPQQATIPLAHAAAPVQDFVQPITPSQPGPSSVPESQQTTQFVSAIQLVECNIRWNCKFHVSGLSSWAALKPSLARQMAEEEEKIKAGEMPFTQSYWEKTFVKLGTADFCMFYMMQVERAKKNNWNLDPLPPLIAEFCFPKQSIAPVPAPISSNAVAHKLLNRSSNNKGKGKARASPYARQ